MLIRLTDNVINNLTQLYNQTPQTIEAPNNHTRSKQNNDSSDAIM